MPTVLLCTTTVGYQARAFDEAARRAGVTLRIVSDRCDHLDDPWGDDAVPARFDRDPRHVAPVLASLRGQRGGRRSSPWAIARPGWRHTSRRPRQLPWHAPAAVAAATHKLLTRGRLLAAGLPVPWFVSVPSRGDDDLERLTRVRFPCVVKPVGLSASRGVIRADSFAELLAARDRVAALLARPDVKAAAATDDDTLIVEAFVPGQEFALDGVLEQGALRVFALFEKPDPLDGPYFEETIYVTPARVAAGPPAGDCRAHRPRRAGPRAAPWADPRRMSCRWRRHRGAGGGTASDWRAVRAGRAGDRPGWIALWPGGRAARARPGAGRSTGFGHQAIASGVLMVPGAGGRTLPRHGAGSMRCGRCRAVTGVEVTARPGTLLERLPEGGRYPGFVFAEADQPDQVVETLRQASRRLRLRVDGALPISPG